MKMEAPPLAHYRLLVQYKPRIGDFIVWAGWFRTWFGMVAGIDGYNLQVVFEGLPSLLLTLTPAEQQKNLHTISLAKITTARPGSYAVLQHDAEHNATIWYI
jgi:hypothetical protein